MAPLLALGAGAHRELTGYENIFLYSALLGRSRADTEQRLDDIIAFAEIGDFVRSPLREYSSGMVARLAFAIAMVERPDLLLVDEVLGVGDEQFREKCHQRFREFQAAGTSTIIVTHQLNYVEQSCDRSAWLAGGRLQSYGPAADVVADFRRERRASRTWEAGVPVVSSATRAARNGGED
jgi:ABC-2 type transport system ATP-binding protein